VQIVLNSGGVDLPHNWSHESLPGTKTSFNRDATGQVSIGFTRGRTGWYLILKATSGNTEAAIFVINSK
jgi:hypothetical protein